MTYRQWSDGWLREGYFLSFARDNVTFYERVVERDLAHWEYEWAEAVAPDTESGPVVIDQLEITRGYSERTKKNHLWQVIFGIKGQILVYIELPTDVHRHGIPKDPKPSTSNRFTSHFEEYMSPFYDPSFLTEHWMVRPETPQIAVSVYNPSDPADQTTMRGIRFNFFINKLVTERIGTVAYDAAGLNSTPTSDRWTKTLDLLYRAQIPCRPISIMPVIMPAAAPSGE